MLEGKTILIISPQSWGNMFLAKHHYAIELAKRGNRVFYLNPPEQTKMNFPSKIEVRPSNVHSNLQLIDHTLFFPYWLRFHITWLFQCLMWFHILKIKSKIKQRIDIIWSFDLNNVYPFRLWGKESLKVFHPIDEPGKEGIQAGRDASVIFSVTQEILSKYNGNPAPKQFFHHGVDEFFFEHANPERPANDLLHCGISGNFTRPDLDRPTLLQIISENPNVIFEFWGSFKAQQSNLGGDDSKEAQQFISSLQAASNVILHGPVSPEKLAEELHQMDVLLICYDILKDQSRGTNYHKVMEYLSTGKVVISNNITTYSKRPELITMTAERDNNSQLPALFRIVVDQIEDYNHPSQQSLRIAFAQEHTYKKQTQRISEALSNLTETTVASNSSFI